MVAAELPDALVVALREDCPPGLAQARDHRDRRAGKPAPGKLVAGAVSSRQNNRNCSRRAPGQADLVPAAHRPLHGLPLAPPENRGGGAAGRRVQYRRELRIDGARAAAGNSSAGTVLSDARLVDDRPGQLRVIVLAGQIARPPLATVPWGKVPTVVGRANRHSRQAAGRHAPAPVRSGGRHQLGAERIGQRHDKRELRPYLARGEQAPHAGGIAIDAPRQLGLR